MSNKEPEENNNEIETKLLSGVIPANLYWDFKRAAVERKESLKEALKNAALLYIDVKREN